MIHLPLLTRVLIKLFLFNKHLPLDDCSFKNVVNSSSRLSKPGTLLRKCTFCYCCPVFFPARKRRRRQDEDSAQQTKKQDHAAEVIQTYMRTSTYSQSLGMDKTITIRISRSDSCLPLSTSEIMCRIEMRYSQ